jgi:catechol 2,3-dioxygenase-like lactoylglutathione lyase family enzyme
VAATHIHTCYRVLDPKRSEDFYVNKLGTKKLGEMHLGSATNHFFAMEEDASSPMLELTHNRNRTEPYNKGDGDVGVAVACATSLSLSFSPKGYGSASAVDIGERCEHDGSLWTPYLNPSTICAPSEARSTAASSAEPTRSSS